MTDKQTKILETSLKLFAEKGFDATSTNKIAKEAGVSEGLIFRHFESKEGLLQAIMQAGKQKAMDMYTPILNLNHPKMRLRKILEFPFQIQSDEYHFWKLIYALKWRSDVYDQSLSAPLRTALLEIFKQLNYADPEAEAECVLLIIDGIATSVLLRKPENIDGIRLSILKKYGLI